MHTIKRALQGLQGGDSGLLNTLTRVWGVNAQPLTEAETVEALARAMLDPGRADSVWSGLNDAQRQVLQALIGSPNATMPRPMFERLFGEIRKMGAGQIERENPLITPASSAEALWYRGLIFERNESAASGIRPVIYVPDDLLHTLPTHRTAYENLEDEDDDPEPDEEISVEPIPEVRNARQADTSIVDDLTTLLAYLQIYTPYVDGDALRPDDRAHLANYLLKPDEDRLVFMLGLALGADLVEIQNERAYPKRAEARRWLSASRPEQVRSLAEAWRDSGYYRDLWHVSGLYPEAGGLLDSYDPRVARQAMSTFLADIAPKGEWWSVEVFIAAVKETDPDFQRPAGDYDSWYIRSERGEYLRGFESWDAVEGALLEFYLTGPMHWLGLVDLADDAARLNAYGRAFVGAAPWPTPPEPVEKMSLREDGTLLVPRTVSRLDRFQVARFTSWGAAGNPYTYRLDADGLSRGADQSIDTGNIAGFISKATDAPLPPALTKMLDNWRATARATVSLERLLVLRTTAVETLDKLWETPALRRYLGARLGETAVVVRADQWEALREALVTQGIRVEVMM